MRFRLPPSPGIAIPGLIRFTVILSLSVATSGCVGQSIKEAREKSTNAYRAHLVSVPADAETAEQAARAGALRARVLHDGWVERGYRVGNGKGADTILYPALGKGLFGGLWYPFKL